MGKRNNNNKKNYAENIPLAPLVTVSAIRNVQPQHLPSVVLLYIHAMGQKQQNVELSNCTIRNVFQTPCHAMTCHLRGGTTEASNAHAHRMASTTTIY